MTAWQTGKIILPGAIASARSVSFSPLACRESTPAECSNEVIAISTWPRCFTICAISTTAPLMPELEAMMNASSGLIDARS